VHLKTKSWRRSGKSQSLTVTFPDLQSHASYSRCGLGSEATDRLVALTRKEMAEARAKGQPSALHGAKITGGGSGGSTNPTPFFRDKSKAATCLQWPIVCIARTTKHCINLKSYLIDPPRIIVF
jgi:hypothetical protein